MWPACLLPQPAAERRLKTKGTAGASATFLMCGLVRMYCYSQGVNWIFDYPLKEAKHQHRRLTRRLGTVYHSVEV